MTRIFSKAVPHSSSFQGCKNHPYVFMVIKTFQVPYRRCLNYITSLVVFYKHRVNLIRYFHLVLNAPKEPYEWKKVVSFSLCSSVPFHQKKKAPQTNYKTNTNENRCIQTNKYKIWTGLAPKMVLEATLQSRRQRRPSWATISPGACRKCGRKKRSCRGSLSLSCTRDLPLKQQARSGI